jgi:hypothetical protein
LWHFRPAAELSSEDTTIRFWDFGRAARYIEFETPLPAAEAAVQKESNGAGGLAVFGNTVRLPRQERLGDRVPRKSPRRRAIR